jgi:hypothetical protein
VALKIPSVIKDKKSKKLRNQGFSYFFCLMLEGSRSGSRSGSVSIMTDTDPGGPKTYGPGSTTLTKTPFRKRVKKNTVDALLAADQISKLQAKDFFQIFFNKIRESVLKQLVP